MPTHVTPGGGARSSRRIVVGGVWLVTLLAIGAGFIASGCAAPTHAAHGLGATTNGTATAATAAPPTTAAKPGSAAPPTSTSTTPVEVGVPGPAGSGFVPGQVTAVGDSVMLDYQSPLEAAIPGIDVNAAVSRQWSDGEAILQGMKAAGQLGGDVVVGLGTNGPITDADFDAMMAILAGASRVVFVNVHVDRPWQDPNNAVIANGAARYHNVVVADWASLAAQNPQWFGSDGTHLPIDGSGADALAALVATTLANG